MSEINYYPSPYETNKTYNVVETTEILIQWGLSINEKKTRDLIAKKRIDAKRAGSENDRRSGYLITGKAIYDFIIEEIPIAKTLLKERLKPAKQNKATRKVTKDTDTTDFKKEEASI